MTQAPIQQSLTQPSSGDDGLSAENRQWLNTEWVAAQQGLSKHLTSQLKTMDMHVALGWSLLGHVATPIVLVALLIMSLILSGIDWQDWFKSKPVPQDLEFVLLPPDTVSQKPLNPVTNRRANQNSRSGGQHQVGQPVQITQQSQATRQAVQKVLTPQVNPDAQMRVQTNTADTANTQTGEQPVQKTVSFLELQKNSDTQTINPQLGVDALQDTNVGGYMQELQKRIRAEWHPPRGTENKQVIVLFTVDKAGKLQAANIKQTSGSPIVDEAALMAINSTFPFRPLPQSLDQDNIEIEFTFDYTLFGNKPRRKRVINNS